MLTITLAFAAGCAILNLWLAMRCGSVRTKEKILHGDGGNVLLSRRMRAHANFAEFTPIVLILFLAVEWTLGSSVWLWAVAGLYLVGRVLHGIGMDGDKDPWQRMVGILLTFLITLGLAGAALYASYVLGSAVDGPAEVGTRA
jgi:uncharacterized protein